jgi:hypothetical protein
MTLCENEVLGPPLISHPVRDFKKNGGQIEVYSTDLSKICRLKFPQILNMQRGIFSNSTSSSVTKLAAGSLSQSIGLEMHSRVGREWKNSYSYMS